MLYSQLLLYTLFFQFLILLFSVPEFQIFLLKETDSVFYILFIHLTFIAVKGRYNVSVMHQIICIIVLAVFSQKFQHIFFKINFSTFLITSSIFEFLNLKFDELHLGYKYKQKKELEKELKEVPSDDKVTRLSFYISELFVSFEN